MRVEQTHHEEAAEDHVTTFKFSSSRDVVSPPLLSPSYNSNSENVKDKVKDATSNKQWGPTGGQMAELATASFHLYTILNQY